MTHIDEQDVALLHRLNAHPILRARVESLLGAVENAAGDLEKADAAERRMIEELRQMGNEALTAWAQQGIERCASEARKAGEDRSGGKKNSIGTPHLVSSR